MKKYTELIVRCFSDENKNSSDRQPNMSYDYRKNFFKPFKKASMEKKEALM